METAVNGPSILTTARSLGREHRLRGVSGRAAARTFAGSFASRRALRGATRLHLGCGDNLLDGWANVDLIGFDGVVPWDLSKPLPVKDGSIGFAFSEHFLEHVSLADAKRHVQDCFRVLRVGGVLRISTPNLRRLIEEYLAGRINEWADVNWHPASPCQMVNEGMRLWGHEFLFDFEELSQLLRDVGFQDVRSVEWHESLHQELRGLECRPDHGEVIVEATK